MRRFADYSDDLGLVLAAARADATGAPVALIGHSQGGTVALDYLTSGREPAYALVLATPWLALKMKVPAVKLVLSRVMGGIWPTLTMGNEIRPEQVSRNPEVIAGWGQDTLIHHVATPRWFNAGKAAGPHPAAGGGRRSPGVDRRVAGLCPGGRADRRDAHISGPVP